MKPSTHVLDRNGREIFEGDRVKIIGEEVAKYLRDSYDNALPESVLSDTTDMIGVVVDDDFFQIVNENGDMLYDLSLDEGEQDTMLEVVTGEWQHAHKEAVNEESPYIPATLGETLCLWFGEESGKRLANSFAHYEPPKKCVYIIHLSNDTVKIGVTQDFYRRMNTISTSSGLEVVNWCHSEYLPKRDAYAIESGCHKIFKEHKTKGEFFNINFEDASTELEKYATITQRFLLA